MDSEIKITPELLEFLEQKAKKATQGKYIILAYGELENYVTLDEYVDKGENICITKKLKDAKYIAAANPTVLLALLKHIKELKDINMGLAIKQKATNFDASRVELLFELSNNQKREIELKQEEIAEMDKALQDAKEKIEKQEKELDYLASWLSALTYGTIPEWRIKAKNNT